MDATDAQDALAEEDSSVGAADATQESDSSLEGAVDGAEAGSADGADAVDGLDSGVDASDADGGVDSGPADADSGPVVGKPVLVGGHNFTCALLASGRVKCFGVNADGQLGLGDVQSRGDQSGEMGQALPAVGLGPGAVATKVSAGEAHACAALVGGALKCWGHNAVGQLGLGDTQNRGDQPGEMGAALPAVDLGPGAIVKSVVAGFHHTCALLDSGQVKCWGMNAYGEAGVGDKSNHGTMPGHMGTALPFVDLGPGQKATALYAGMGTSCAVLESGPIKCWGRNHVGQLGLGDTQDRGDQPGEMGAALPAVNLGPGAKVVALAMGREHTCALLDDHTVKCWGGNTHGQLGQGDTNARGAVPTDMGSNLPVVDLGPGLQPVALSVSAIAFHTCALFPNGAFKCWGLNMHGQLGIGAGPDKRGDAPGEMGTNLPFVNVGTGAQTAALAAGALHSCAVLQTGAVKCWGNNSEGQCGVGDTVFRGMLPSSMGDALPAADLGM